MEPSADSLRSRLTARSFFGALILVAHAAVAIALARSTLIQPRESLPPLQVALLDQPETPRDIPPPAHPELVPVRTVTIPPPEVFISVEPESNAITATIARPTTTVAVASPGEPPSMSEVAYVRPPIPRYPGESKRAREEGLVVLRVLIDESGHACRIEVFRSSGHPRLDAAARDAVEQAVFKPYLEGGTARAAHAMIPVEFSLRGSRRS